jgi:S1-C subfamily serine protease
MAKVRRALSNPLGAGMIGGLVAALIWALAIGAGVLGGGTSSGAVQARTGPISAQPVVSDHSGSGSLNISQIYRRDAKGVVYIEAQQGPGGSSVPTPNGAGTGQTATGSGFVIDRSGDILTNAHVVDGAQRVTVTLGSGSRTFDATVVGTDQSTDVAVLKIDAPARDLDPLALGDSSAVRVGDSVLAIGNPYGLDRTATSGIVSAVQRDIKAPNGATIQNAIQTDAAINPGNSGGPLIDSQGSVVGITSQIESSNGSGNVGIGFAVPINTVRAMANQILQGSASPTP